MNYKELKGYLIAIDIDGTIIDENFNKDIESLDLLKELSKNNIIVIASGRPYRSSKIYYDYLDLKSPIINYNGAYVHNPNDKNFKEIMVTINKNNLIDLIDNNKDYITNAFSEIKDDVYLIKEDETVEPFIDRLGANIIVGDYKETLKGNTNGSIIFSKYGAMDKLNNYIKEHNFPFLLRPWDFNHQLIIEVFNKDVSKAKALDIIRKYYNIKKEHTIAFGDGHNDIEMLEYVRFGVAMENSHPELIKNAKYITKSVKEHGIKEFFTKQNFLDN